MINHLNIAKNLKSNSINMALDIYESNIKDFKRSAKELKLYLSKLNMFLYTYFLVQYNKDLESYALKCSKLFTKENSPEKLRAIGEKMLIGYSNNFSLALKENDHELVEIALEYINKNYTKKLLFNQLPQNYISQEITYAICLKLKQVINFASILIYKG
ncbi:AraC family transcriptional regulator [Peptoniphilus lacrimalis]|uniref:Uncharacterized protein n=1 Tax=Peptoniphilus lacrimalis TaxID=33031 RepID=A0A379C4Q7_9FIRM|nr:AraC family transcriptional regulator [Peptoniphilus lacrimalis]SUB56596.1 Uncharacterised protein [Peptoniphilus lacrimalis]